MDGPTDMLEWKSLVLRKLELQIESDASLSRWGTSCQGILMGDLWAQVSTSIAWSY